MQSAPYIHGTSPGEQLRLGWMNRLLNDLELEAIGLEGGERALEMGAGTGLFACALAGGLGRGSVLGIELDAEQLTTARSVAGSIPNLELRQGDVLRPPLRDEEWGSFDLVHARFLLEHLTQPEEAVRVMARAVRPGGRVVLADDDHDVLRLWPAAPRFEELWGAYCRQYTLRGTDPFVGRRLTGLLSAAGLRPIDARQLSYGACAGMELFPLAFANLTHVVEGAVPDILRNGTLDEARVRAAFDEIQAWQELPGAALWYSIPLASAVRPSTP